MRSRDEIINDPQASVEEIYSLPEPRDQLNHPNCPHGLWWQLAAIEPIVAMRSPLYPLMTLEDPAAWPGLADGELTRWISMGMNGLSIQRQYQFAVECLERSWPLVEKATTLVPYQMERLEAAMQPWREMAARTMDVTSFQGRDGFGSHRMPQVKLVKRWPESKLNAGETINTMVEALSMTFAYGGVSTAASVRFATEGNAGVKQERYWQWHRLLQYLEVTP